jgi:hypothetical protein
MDTGAVEFTLRPAGFAAPVHVRMRKRADRWAAEVRGPLSAVGIGSSAREALTAALEPFGEVRLRRLLADLGLLAPSIAILEWSRAASGSEPL